MSENLSRFAWLKIGMEILSLRVLKGRVLGSEPMSSWSHTGSQAIQSSLPTLALQFLILIHRFLDVSHVTPAIASTLA